jgi:hypothetical protein
VRNPAFSAALSQLLNELRTRGWVWRLSMLWVVLGAGGAVYGFLCAMIGCTTNQCTNDEFWFLIFNGEPLAIIAVAAPATAAWLVLTVPLLFAGFIRLRGWRRRAWLRATAWVGSWVAGLAIMVAAVIVAGSGSDVPDIGWCELPIFAAWLALGAAINRILSAPAVSGR